MSLNLQFNDFLFKFSVHQRNTKKQFNLKELTAHKTHSLIPNRAAIVRKHLQRQFERFASLSQLYNDQIHNLRIQI